MWRGVMAAALPPLPCGASPCQRVSRRVRVPVAAAVKVEVESRTVTVTGPRGKLSREFKHISVDTVPLGKGSIRFDMWFGNRAQLATIRTMTTHIENMIVGVTRGYCYRMRFAYAHFPINVQVLGAAGGEQFVEIRNFLGQRRVRKIQVLPGVTVVKSADVKDQLELTGNDIELVSRSGVCPLLSSPLASSMRVCDCVPLTVSRRPCVSVTVTAALCVCASQLR